MTEETCVRCKSVISSGGVQFKKRVYCDSCVKEFESIADNGVVIRSRHGKHDHEKKPYIVTGGGKQYIEHSQTEALARGKNLTEELDCRALFIYWRNGSHWTLSTYLDQHPEIASDVESARRKIRGQEPVHLDNTDQSAGNQTNVRAAGDAIVDSTIVDDSVVNRSSINNKEDS